MPMSTATERIVLIKGADRKEKKPNRPQIYSKKGPTPKENRGQGGPKEKGDGQGHLPARILGVLTEKVTLRGETETKGGAQGNLREMSI